MLYFDAFIQLLILLNTMENLTFFSLWSSKVNVLNFCGWRWLGFDGATQEAARSVTVEDSMIFNEISVQKSKDAIWVQTSAKPARQLQCAERISPELRAITYVSNVASFNLWECII